VPRQIFVAPRGKTGQWLRPLLIIVVLAIGLYGASLRQQNRPRADKPTPARGEATSASPVAGGDIGATLERIRRGERLDFSHDGSIFENRERRLPKRPAGYYREYVHPTQVLDGPGPQRIVVGKQGETYYTADHYRTFQRIDHP